MTSLFGCSQLPYFLLKLSIFSILSVVFIKNVFVKKILDNNVLLSSCWINMDGQPQRVTANRVKSSRHKVISGVPQGSVSIIWTRRSSAPTVSLETTPSRAEVLICSRAGSSAEGSGQAGLMGRGQLYELQQGQVPGPALQSQQRHAALQAWGGVAGKLTSRKGPGVAGQQLAEHEPAVRPGGQKVQQHPGFYQEKCGQQE